MTNDEDNVRALMRCLTPPDGVIVSKEEARAARLFESMLRLSFAQARAAERLDLGEYLATRGRNGESGSAVVVDALRWLNARASLAPLATVTP